MVRKIRKHGEGSLFRRKDGRWQASFTPANSNGRKYVYGKTKGEALEKLRQAQEEDRKGILATGPRQKLGEYLPQWLENVYKPTVRRSSYEQHRYMSEGHIIPSLGAIYLHQLTPQHLQAFYARKLQEGLKPRSIAVLHAIIHSALENAVKWNLVSRNVASLVSKPRVERYEVHPLTPTQAQVLINAAKETSLEALLTLAVTTGMRRGELLGLHWEDVDLRSGFLHVRRTLSHFSGSGFVEGDPKTKSSRRKVLLPTIAIEALKAHRSRQEQAKAQAGEKWREHHLVFCTAVGNYLHAEIVRRHFHDLLKKAGLPPMRFHDLRHSAATILLIMGVHSKVVQELLGHSTITMTIDTYSHLLPSLQQEAVEKMNDVFRSDTDGVLSYLDGREPTLEERIAALERALAVMRLEQIDTRQIEERISVLQQQLDEGNVV
jgi:integrase